VGRLDALEAQLGSLDVETLTPIAVSDALWLVRIAQAARGFTEALSEFRHRGREFGDVGLLGMYRAEDHLRARLKDG
jgi:hypothetical protein